MQADDELDLSLSDPARLESPAKARRKAFEQKLKKEGISLTAAAATSDKNKLKLSLLKGQMAGQQDSEAKRDARQKNGQKPDRSFGTKTREQEIKQSKLTADTKPTADALVDQTKIDAAAKQEQQRTEVQPDSSS
jgi:hypothetical protein